MKRWLCNAKLISAAGFLILVALIWLLGPWAGLKSIESRFAWIFAVMLLWVTSLLAGQLLANKAGGLIKKMLQTQADDAVMNASADKRAEVTLLRQRLLGAIDTLKTSRLGKARGNAALYELPWYMIIGHPAAGKSSAILQSGLTFPFSGEGGIQGVGGTRNCDWFFSTEGVLLDTAGRYATQSEDRSEWVSFLKLLKRYRSKAPVNGILVAISLPELAQHNSESFTLYARQIRERIHEIEDNFGLQVPIYLILTKLDLLGGFCQFFEDDNNDALRNKVWGATFPAEQGQGFDATIATGQQFDCLYRGLVQIGEEKLAQYRGAESRPAYFAFPIEFHGLRDAVVKFVRLLHEEDPYHAKPLLRGFYFTSALQEGVPRIAAASRISSQFNLDRTGLKVPQGVASYGYFLRDLFREVIFHDQHLVCRQTKPAAGRLRLAGMLSGLSLLATIAGIWTWSYIGNQKLIAQVGHEYHQAQLQSKSAQIYERLKALDKLQQRIEQLQAFKNNGHPWQIGLGLYQGGKLEANLRKEYFAGIREIMLTPVKQSLESTLMQLAKQRLIPAAKLPSAVKANDHDKKTAPVIPQQKPRMQRSVPGKRLPTIDVSVWHIPQRATASRQTNTIQAPDANQAIKLDQGYNALKTYLMLHEQNKMDEAHLADQLPRHWRNWLESNRGEYRQEEIMALAERLVAFYVNQIKAPDLPLIENNTQIVSGAREILRGSITQLSAEERAYGEIKARANAKFAPLTVARILNNQNMDIVAGSQMVAGAFTREALDSYIRGAIEDACKGEIKGEDWVLASSISGGLGRAGDIDKSRAQLLALYKAEYANEWKKFLQGVAIRDFTDLNSSVNAISKLADQNNSPTKQLLIRAAYETAWDNPSEVSRKIEHAKQSMLERTTEFLKGTDSLKNESGPEYGIVGAQFSGITNLVHGKGNGAPIDGYFAHLEKLKLKLAKLASSDATGEQLRATVQATLNGSNSELSETLNYVDGTLLSNSNQETREIVRPLLTRPLIQAYSAMLGPLENEINQAWQREVYGQWKTLSGKYPFSDTGMEAPMSDINKFIKPNDGTIDKFVSKYLNGLIVKKGDKFTPRTWANLGLHFNPAFLSSIERLSSISSVQLSESDNARLELQPVPTPGLSEILLEIDGQDMRYRNGPQPWQTFTWPGTGKQQGARLQVVAFNGESITVSNQQGRMGLVRLLSQAQARNLDSQTVQLSWKTPKTNSRDPEIISLNFRLVGGVNPLQISGLRRLSLPERVTL